jgi:hypothetical protein
MKSIKRKVEIALAIFGLAAGLFLVADRLVTGYARPRVISRGFPGRFAIKAGDVVIHVDFPEPYTTTPYCYLTDEDARGYQPVTDLDGKLISMTSTFFYDTSPRGIRIWRDQPTPTTIDWYCVGAP